MKRILMLGLVLVVAGGTIVGLGLNEAGAFSVNDAVKVVTPKTPVFSGTNFQGIDFLGDQYWDSEGVVLQKGTRSGGYSILKIDFISGADGWVDETSMGLVSVSNPGGDTPAPSTIFSVGDKIEVVTTELRVRNGPSLDSLTLSRVYTGDKGEIAEGPVYRDGYNWWRIKNWNGQTFNAGWSVEGDQAGNLYIKKVGVSQTGQSTKFSVNDRVQTTNDLNIRATPGGNLLGEQSVGVFGVIVGGPVDASVNETDYWWWRIDFDNSILDGWAVENYLEKVPVNGQQPQCSDGVDNDSDGKIDFPTDPGCSSLADTNEQDAVQTSQCSDGIDNDGDGKIDFPADPGCSSVTDNSETDGGGGNNPPIITGVVGPTPLNDGQLGSWIVFASDPDDNPLTYEAIWGDGSVTPAGTASVLTHTFAAAGTYSAVFKVKDAGGLSAQYPLTVTVASTAVASFAVGDMVSIVGGLQNLPIRSDPSSSALILGTRSGNPYFSSGPVGVVTEVRLVGNTYWYKINWRAYDFSPAVEGWSLYGSYFYRVAGAGTPSTSTIAVGDRVEVNGYTPVYSGFGQFGPLRGVVVEGQQVVGGYTQVLVDYDYGLTRSTRVDSLSLIGHLTGEWAWTPDNYLGRKIQPAQGNIFIEPYYYYVESGQVSMPSTQAQSSLPSAALTIQAGSGANWSCQSISEASPFRWVGYRCSYKKGNQPPVVNLTGLANAIVNVQGAWQFTASDPEGALASYRVDWGDESSSGGEVISGASVTKDISHTYTRVGTFNIKVMVTDGGGLSAESTATATVTAPCSTRFQLNARVKVINAGAENPLNVRSSPVVPANRDANKLGGHYAGDLGTISSGPQSGSGYCWWNINYDAAPDGWSAEGDSAAGTYWLEGIAGDPYQGPQTSPNIPTNPDPSSPIITSLTVGDYVRTLDFVNVRETPNGRVISSQFISSIGKIVGGPVSAGGLTWWNIDYTSPPDGWSAEKDLAGRVLLIKTSGPQIDNPSTAAPVLSPITEPTSIDVNVQGTWQVLANDSDSTSLTFSVTWGDGNTNTYSGPSGQAVAITHTYTQAGPKIIQVTVTDGQAADSESLSIVVGQTVGGNQPPVVNTFTGSQSLTVNSPGSWQIGGRDPEGSALSYSVNWGDGRSNTYTGSSGQTINASYTYSATGVYSASVTVSDGSLTSAPRNLTITVGSGGQPGNSTKFRIGDGVRASENVTVRNGEAGGWGRIGGQAGLSEGAVIGGPVFWNGYWYWEINYNSGVDGWSAEDWLELYMPAAGGNQAPHIIKFLHVGTVLPFYENSPATYQFAATDPEGSNLTYQFNWKDGSPIDTYYGPSGQTVIANHVYDTPGTYWITVTALDPLSASDTRELEIIIAKDPNELPPPAPPAKISSDSFTDPTSVFVGDNNFWRFKIDGGSTAYCQGRVTYTVDWGDGSPIFTYVDDCPISAGTIPYPGYSGNYGAEHVYMRAGTFTIKADIVSTVVGRSGSDSKSLTVTATYKPLTISKFEVSKGTDQRNYSINYAASGGAPGLIRYEIDWGDGVVDVFNKNAVSNSNTQWYSHSHLYQAIGNWTPKLTVTDSAGQRATRQYAPTGGTNPPTVISIAGPGTMYLNQYGTQPSAWWYVLASDVVKNKIYISADYNSDGTPDANKEFNYSSSNRYSFSNQLTQPGTYTATILVGNGQWASPVSTVFVVKPFAELAIPSTKFSIGDKVTVKAGPMKNSMGSGGSITGYATPGQGVVLGGPVAGDNTYNWKVGTVDGQVGWMVEGHLEKISSGSVKGSQFVRDWYPIEDKFLWSGGGVEDKSANQVARNQNKTFVKFVAPSDLSSVVSADFQLDIARNNIVTTGGSIKLYKIPDYGTLGSEDWDQPNKQFIKDVSAAVQSATQHHDVTSHITPGVNVFMFEADSGGNTFYLGSGDDKGYPTQPRSFINLKYN